MAVSVKSVKDTYLQNVLFVSILEFSRISDFVKAAAKFVELRLSRITTQI